MRYGEGLLEEIRKRTDLVGLVGRRVKLVRKGRVMWGCCPFHPEKSPSFKVENERRLYKCFGCGNGGDAFKWLMETEGLSFPESVEKLAGEVGVELPKWSPEDEAREKRKKSLYEIVELAAVFYQEQLFGEGGRAAQNYLKGRGLDGAAARQFRLGYAPSGGTALIEYLTAHNVTQDEMIEAGLARPAQDGRPMRDFFFDRILFPITDGRSRVIAFGGRGMAPDAKPKYINTGETPLFSKGGNLYNLPTARAAAIKAGTIILAEGYMDVIALVRAGFVHAVAPLGTAFTEDQLQMLWRAAPEPVLAFDGDNAGQNAALRAAHMALPHLKAGYSLRFAFLPQGEDPDTLIAAQGPGAMAGLIDTAMPLVDLLWRDGNRGTRIFPPPNAWPGWNAAWRNSPPRSATARSRAITATLSGKRSSLPTSAVPRQAEMGPPHAGAGRSAAAPGSSFPAPCRARPRRSPPPSGPANWLSPARWPPAKSRKANWPHCCWKSPESPSTTPNCWRNCRSGTLRLTGCAPKS